MKIGAVSRQKFKYLGIDLEDSKEGITMSQDGYVKRKLNNIEIKSGKSKEVLSKEDQTLYRSLLGRMN